MSPSEMEEMEDTPAPEHLSKVDAARRQLEAAVQLYFDEADPVAIHTLAAAALGILDALARHRGLRSLRARLLEDIRPERRSEFKQRLDASRNFFKHADRDPDSSIFFSAWETNVWLLDGVLTFRRVTGENPPLGAAYLVWSNLTWARDILEWPDATADELRALEQVRARLSQQSRADFLREHLPRLRRAAARRAKTGDVDSYTQ